MRRLPTPLLFLFLFASLLLLAQRQDSVEMERQAKDLRSAEKYPEAAKLLVQLQEYDLRAKDWKAYSNRTLELTDSYFECHSFDTCLAILDQAIATLTAAGWADSLPVARLWAWKAVTLANQDRFTEDLDAYDQATRVYERNGYNGPIVAYCYKNAAQVFIRRQDYTQANQYLEAAILSDSTGSDLLSIYSQLANNAYCQDSLDNALAYFNTGKSLPGYGGPESSHLLSIGGDILVKKGRLAEAKALAVKALSYFLPDPEDVENRMRCYTTLADIAKLRGNWLEAATCYRKAEQDGLANIKRKSREMAKLYTEWGDFLLRQNQKAEALTCYQKAIIEAFPGFDALNPAVNPDKKDAPVEQWAMNATARKAALLLLDPTLAARENAAQCFDLAFAAAERLRRVFGNDDAKLYLAEQNFDIRRSAVLNLWALYGQTGQVAILERLFTLLEDNRANALRDALQQQRALALAGIPDSLLRQEQALRLEIAAAQRDLNEHQNTADSVERKWINAELGRIKRHYDQLLASLQKTYPQFAEFDNAGETADVASIRAALPPSAALLSWFDAGDRYLCLTLRATGLSAFEIPRDTALDARLLRFQTLLADKSRQENDPAGFFADAYFLKQRLLPDSSLSGAGNLIIIPDGGLSYLPFEALLTAPHQGGYSTAPYLLRAHAVQYAWSASLLKADAATGHNGHGLLQVAPFVRSARDGLAILPNSLHEKPENTAAEVLEGTQAIADTFLREARQFDVLHLSTHAHAGQKEQPGIEFYDRTVWLPEIYTQRLHASLVSLSACETGAGAFAEGEGVLSLARAFAYAGARSLVASHWSVNERSTADLFDAFYQFLGQGRSKAEALQKAKLQMLSRNGPDARKAPFHWAAFTLSGADGTVDLGGSWPIWRWALAAAIALLGIWSGRRVFIRYVKRRRAAADGKKR